MSLASHQHRQNVLRVMARHGCFLWLLLATECGSRTAPSHPDSSLSAGADGAISSGSAGGGVDGGAGGGAGGARSGGTWIKRTAGADASGQSWTDVASDSTGIHLVAVASFWTN